MKSICRKCGDAATCGGAQLSVVDASMCGALAGLVDEVRATRLGTGCAGSTRHGAMGGSRRRTVYSWGERQREVRSRRHPPVLSGCSDPVKRHRLLRASANVPASVLVALKRDDLILLLHRLGDDAWGGLWTWPGGKVEPGESPADAAMREVREEIGWHIHEPALLASRTVTARSGATRTFHLCMAQAPDEEPVLNDEHDAWEWVPPERFLDQDLDDRAASSERFAIWLTNVGLPFVELIRRRSSPTVAPESDL